jgi:hypothetical protein
MRRRGGGQPRGSGQRQPSGIGDLHPDNLDRLLASMHGLGSRRRQPFVHEVDQQIGREAMRQQSRFGAAAWAASEYFERPMPLALIAVDRA